MRAHWCSRLITHSRWSVCRGTTQMTTEVARALSAQEQITAHIQAFRYSGGPDLEEADRALARANGIPETKVSALWAQARAEKAAEQRLVLVEPPKIRRREKEFGAGVVQQAIVQQVVKQRFKPIEPPAPV